MYPSSESPVVFGTEDLLRSLCDSVSEVLSVATHGEIRYSGMVQRIARTCLKPDIGCFVLFDGGFSGLVVINFSAAAAMELYEKYMLGMGMARSELAASYTSDDVGNVMGELMNQCMGDFTSKIGRELQTNITQNQPRMLSLTKQVVVSIDTNIAHPEMRRVTFYTGENNIFYLELAVDRTEFIKLKDFEVQAVADPDALLEQEQATRAAGAAPAAPAASDVSGGEDHDALLKSLGM